MGLDIHVSCDKGKEMRNDPNYTHGTTSLSRSFCRLLTASFNLKREDLELTKIGEICGIDISIFLKMLESPGDFEIRLPYVKSEEEREHLLQKIELATQKLANNFSTVQQTLLSLIEKLQAIPNLSTLLQESRNEQSVIPSYFDDFNSNPGDGYIGNNFGQDLRNFKYYLELATKYNASSVWFDLG